MDDDNIVHLKQKIDRNDAADAPILKVIDGFRSECNHKSIYKDGRFVDVTYQIREGETEVECGNCETKLDPMWVLRQLANKESSWNRSRQRYNDEMKRLAERSRTKCDNCGKMTRISRT